MKKTETRYTPATELRVAKRADGTFEKITGYAAMFNSLSSTLGSGKNQFVERIKPGAFKRALSEGSDVRALFNHDANKVLGRTKNNTLTLTEDDKGLRFEATLNQDDAEAMSTAAKIDRGDVDGCSFAFRATKDDWKQEDGRSVRELLDVDLFDVGPVTYPAYDSTTVDVRSARASIAKLEKRCGGSPYDFDPGIGYVARYALRACRDAFDALSSVLDQVEQLAEGSELSPADERAMGNLFDQVEDLDEMIDDAQESCGDLCPSDDEMASKDPDDDEEEGDDEKAEGDMTDVEESSKGKRSRRRRHRERRAGHMTHSDTGPTLNADAEKNALAMVAAGKIDEGEWTWSAEDATTLLGKDDWDNYAKWFLAEDKNADEKTQDRYKYPFGKEGMVYRRAVAAIRTRASQQDATAIYDAAGRIMDAMDKKKTDDAGRSSAPATDYRSRLRMRLAAAEV